MATKNTKKAETKAAAEQQTTTNTENTDPKRARAIQRRQELRELSNKLVKENKDKVDDGVKVNELLIQYYMQRKGAKELNTFEQWKYRGFQVKKGSVSFMVWGKPLKEQDTENEEKEVSDEYRDFFPVCHLFDISQVAPIQTKSN